MYYETEAEIKFDEALEKLEKEAEERDYEDPEEYADEQWRKHFVIEDDQTADWAMNEIRKAKAEKERWKQFYDERYRAICADADRTIANMESILMTYFQKVPHKVTSTQENYTLPSGKLVIKKQEPEYERDDDKILEWLHKSGKEQFVKTKESVNWSSLKNTLNILGDTASDENGEIVPGLRVVEREDIFKVELKKEDNHG